MVIRASADGVPRGRGGNPKIIMGDGTTVLYKRSSNIPKALDDLGNLLNWYGRQSILGVIARPDLLRRVQTDPSSINEVQKLAHEAAGSSAAASDGTNVHAWTALLDDDPGLIGTAPPEYRHALESYLRLMEPYEVLETELFVVDDDLQCAGSMDRLVMCPDGRARVLDIKTGQWASTYGARAAAIQVAIYANSVRYDPETGDRERLHPDIDDCEGLMLHLPLDGEPGAYRLDLVAGYNGARLAKQVMAFRNTDPISSVLVQSGGRTMT